jgi:hypothetical protein
MISHFSLMQYRCGLEKSLVVEHTYGRTIILVRIEPNNSEILRDSIWKSILAYHYDSYDTIKAKQGHHMSL